MSLPDVVVPAATGLAVAGIGALIRFGGYTSLIAGYDPERVTDEDAVARAVGTGIIAVGALTVLAGLATGYAGDDANWVWPLYVVVVLVLLVRMVSAARRHTE